MTLLDGIAGVAIVNDNDFGFDQPADLTISPSANPTEQLRFYTTRAVGHGADGRAAPRRPAAR